MDIKIFEKTVPSDDRTGKPENSSHPGYSKEDHGRSWSAQEWKSLAAEHYRSGKPEEISWVFFFCKKLNIPQGTER